MPVIDVHAHYLPASLGERFTDLSGVRYPLRHTSEQSRRIADLDLAGVDAQILGLGAVQPYWADRSASVAGAQFANNLYADVTAAHSGRLLAFGAVPLPHAEDAAREAARCLDQLGFAGVGLGCSAQGSPLDERRFDVFWNELDKRGAIAYLHPGVANDGLIGVSDYPMLLGPVFGSPAEQAVAVARLVLAGTTDRYPNIRFVAAAMGGTLLTALSKFADSLDRGKLHGQQHDSDDVLRSLRRIWFDSSAIDPVLTLAARRADVMDRVVLGSDSPWGSAAGVIHALQDNLDVDELEGVLGRGAALLPDRMVIR